MISFRPTAWMTVTLAVGTLGFTGCWTSKGKGGSKPAPVTTAPANPAAIPAWLGKGPLDEVGRQLAELDCGDPVRSWRAEEDLGAYGPALAPRTRAALAASTPEARAAACRLAYKFGDQAAIPGMIALLADESRLVRNTANVFLCGLTDRDFNFRPDAIPADRAAAKARWEAWYGATYGPVVPPKRK